MLAAHVAAIVLSSPFLVADAPSPTPTPRPSPTPVKAIGTITVLGRSANVVGKAMAASTGTISQEQIVDRPIMRPGELLEQIPGLVISQHSGGGKANQYYLRGFQLDHGTDLESTVLGVPVNMPTHAHGQGYSDINWLIPELVSYVEFKKGPYYADQGDFSTAGAYNLFYRNKTEPIVSFGVGEHAYERLFVAAAPRLGAGNLLYALELYHDNADLVKPDRYHKLNGVLRWSRTTASSDFNVTATAYGGAFDSSDQIPQRLVDDGALSRFGFIDGSDGGITHRTALSTQWQRTDRRGTMKLDGYAFDYGLNLFSNFTYNLDDATDYYNVTANPVTCKPVYTTCTPGTPHAPGYTSYCPANVTPTMGATAPRSVVPAPFSFSCGDQREQVDKRFVTGFNASRSFQTPATETIIGVGTRNDNISSVALYLGKNRIRFPNGTLVEDHVVERASALWVQTSAHLGPKVRLIGGLRGDLYSFRVAALDPRDSGTARQGIVSPKFSAAFATFKSDELYANFGGSFHSNDGRGITQTLDPQTHAPFDPTGAPVVNVSPLVRAIGEEVGYRHFTPKFNTTLTLWQLNIASELVFSGDHGTTSAGSPTVRRGVELSNYFTPQPGVIYDADLATSTARFLDDPSHQGTGVPESLAAVISAGATLDRPAFATSLRMRYFGPRTLVQSGDAVSRPSMLFNGQFIKKFASGQRLSFDVFNLLNANADEVTYFYGSWLPRDGAMAALAADPGINPALGGGGVNDFHFHPSERRTIRLTYSVRP